MSIESEKKLLDEKKLVAKKVMDWDTCMYRLWNPQDPEKATCSDWNLIFEKLKEKDLMNPFIEIIFNDRDQNKISTYTDMYIEMISYPVEKRWKKLIETINKKDCKDDYVSFYFNSNP